MCLEEDPADPRIVPCGNHHVFCLRCLQRLARHQDDHHHDHTENQFPCPLCRNVVAIPPGGVEAFEPSVGPKGARVAFPPTRPTAQQPGRPLPLPREQQPWTTPKGQPPLKTGRDTPMEERLMLPTLQRQASIPQGNAAGGVVQWVSELHKAVADKRERRLQRQEEKRSRKLARILQLQERFQAKMERKRQQREEKMSQKLARLLDRRLRIEDEGMRRHWRIEL